MDDDALARLFFEALQHLGAGASPAEIADRVRVLEIGLPAEEQFCAIANWLGRVRLIHKLDQFQTPSSSRDRWRVPDLLGIFEHRERDVPVLIEVKTSEDRTLSWRPDYLAAHQRYADAVNLPLLVAWRHHSFWALFEVRHFAKAKKNFNISFSTAMKQSLMGELLGVFSFSLRPGCGLHLRIKKLTPETDEGFHGLIEEAFWEKPNGDRVKNAPGVLPLFTCLDQEPVLTDEGTHVQQSFVIPHNHQAEFAHRALVTLLRLVTHGDEVRWPQILEEGRGVPTVPKGLRVAARQALDSGFLEYGIDYSPNSMPTFLRSP